MNSIDVILLEIYQTVYSEIGVDFEHIITTEGMNEDWFLEYSLPHQRQEEILNDILSKHNLSLREKRKIEIAYWLGCSPKSI